MFISRNGIYFSHNLNLGETTIEKYSRGYVFMWDNWVYKYTRHITENEYDARSFILATSLV